MAATVTGPQPGNIVRLDVATSVDAAALFAACDGPNRPGAILLESADISTKERLQSILVLDPAVAITVTGLDVEVRPLTAAGMVLAEAAAGAGCRAAQVTPLPATATDSGPGYRFSYHRSTAADESQRLRAPHPVDVLRFFQAGGTGQCDPAAPLGLPFVAGGFASEFIDTFETLPQLGPSANTFPDGRFTVAQTLVIIDHQTGQARVEGISYGTDPGTASAVAQRVTHLAELLTAGVEPITPTTPVVPGGSLLQAQATTSDSDFRHHVEAMQERIAAGDIYQVVPARGFTLPCPDPLAAYLQMRRINPSPYMFYLAGEDYTLFGASPEAAVTVRAATRRVEMYPIAGTRPRGFNPDGSINHEVDTRFELDLRTDSKELSEHVMLVDLARNDLARIAAPGTRRVDKLLGVDRYSRVMHLVSRVVATLAPDLDGLDAYLACMNMGTLTGAPKLSATTLLRSVERVRRGSYGGAVGYLAGNGDLDTCIVIRSAFVRDGIALVQAGAGVVRDSDPQAEADETVHKAMAVLTAIAASQGAEVRVIR